MDSHCTENYNCGCPTCTVQLAYVRDVLARRPRRIKNSNWADEYEADEVEADAVEADEVKADEVKVFMPN